eukprot:4514959-Prymnesium_polylepis.1
MYAKLKLRSASAKKCCVAWKSVPVREMSTTYSAHAWLTIRRKCSCELKSTIVGSHLTCRLLTTAAKRMSSGAQILQSPCMKW